MKTYFIVSDCHSFFTPLKTSLKSAGFNIKNKDHILVVDGDLFDRGTETIELFNFIKSIPKSRRILIRGNHERLYLDLLKKDFPERHDFHNGTVNTFCAIANVILEKNDAAKLYRVWPAVVDLVKQSKITQFIKSNEWKNFYELDNYIITHSFIPLKLKDDVNFNDIIYCMQLNDVNTRFLEYNPNWRENTSDYLWEEANWLDAYKWFPAHFFDEEIKNNKILVCGHRPTAVFHNLFEKDFIDESTNSLDRAPNFNIFYDKNLIAIDGNIIRSNQQNVLVIKDGKCFDQNQNELKILNEV